MNIEDFTPFTPATFVSAKDGTGYVTTVIVKATFGMRHGAVAQPLDEQLFPCGDAYPEGADPAVTSLVYASDFMPYKLRGDVLLLATAYRPANQPSGSFRVAVRVGQLTKQLVVSGRREFKHGIVSSSIIEVEPLAAIPVTYENAFGGPNNPRNPVGRGHKTNVLPMIEYNDQRMQQPGDRPAPAGLGPIAADWEPRKSMVGTFGPDYLEKHWPGFPGNFDPSYFNAAPADQQVAGYLRGDEEIVLENLHRQHATFATQLPGWQVVCTREHQAGQCELIPLVIDTLWINPDAEQLVLIWRGRTSVQSPDALEIKRLGFMVQPLSMPLRDAAYYAGRLQEFIDERDAEFEAESPPTQVISAPPDKEGDKQPQPDSPAEDPDDAYLRTVQAKVAAIRAQAGHAPEPELQPTEPPPLSPEAQAKYDEIMAKIEEEDRQAAEDEESKKWTREKVIAAARNRQSLAGAGLSRLDLSGCDFSGTDFRGATLNGADFSRSLLTRAVLVGCSMAGARLDAAMLHEAILDGVNLRGASLTQATLTAARLIKADLTNAVLDGADLSRAMAQQAVLNASSLSGAKLAQADLTAAVLSNVKGARADFSEAVLVGTLCDHADFTGGSFQNADIRDAIFSGGQLTGCNLEGAQAVASDFTEADLVGATFRGANCEGMWLSSAKADGAVFQAASCVDLQVDGTSAKQANFADSCIASFRGGKQADLSGASFRNVHGDGPIFETCLLDGADFSQASIPGANFVNASVTQSNFTAANLKGARFDYANGQSAVFVTANLFQATFPGANLNGADISAGNFYGVEFLDARISKLRFKDCNLQMTKLEQWAATKNNS
jgi:uncharacterized protein YjbI with pentapeptide repeats